jgi:ABC-type multidrug transport system fused ATPase/permease subunit
MFRVFFKFLYILAGKKRQLIFLIFLFLLTSLLETFGIGLVGPFIALATKPKLIHQNDWSSWIYTQFGFHSEIQFISILGLGIVGILYLKSFLGFNTQKHIFEFGFGQQANLRVRLMQSYLQAPYSFHLNRNTAVLIQNIITETDKFANGVLMPVLFSVSNLTITCALTLLLLKTDLIATTTILGILLFLFLILYRFKDKLVRWGKEGHEADVEMIRIINHGLGGVKETKVIGCESYFENQLKEQAQKFKVAVASANAFSLLPRYALEPVIITFLVGFTIAYLLFNQTPETLTATLGVFGMASIRLLPAASNLMQTFGGLKYSSYIVDRLYFDLKELEKVEVKKKLKLSNKTKLVNLSDAHFDKQTLSFREQIILDKITYHYPLISEAALKNISLVINRGQSIGLIGKSGAGKTTLVDVILGLLTPQSGDIKVDGVSINSNLGDWQNLLGYIPQSIFLIDDTIERNIAFGVPDEGIDQRKLEKAIAAAQLTELVDTLPNGIKTVVGERGVRLSGGQRQRVGIARALYHEREILVLDEATAALDNETENLVSEAIKSLSGTKTMIIIAHRLSTIEHCDRIYMMDQGRILMSGSYEEVVLRKK